MCCLFGNSVRGTTFQPADLQELGEFTGFLTGEGFKLGSTGKFVDPLVSYQ